MTMIIPEHYRMLAERAWPLNEESLVAAFTRNGKKLTAATRGIVKAAAKLSRDELTEFLHWTTLEDLTYGNLTPEQRRELLNTLEKCPCCESWLGHNQPPPGTPIADEPPTPPKPRRSSYFR